MHAKIPINIFYVFEFNDFEGRIDRINNDNNNNNIPF